MLYSVLRLVFNFLNIKKYIPVILTDFELLPSFGCFDKKERKKMSGVDAPGDF